MLHKQTGEPRTLSLLEGLMQLDFLSTFNLVGGTALSLKLGHRISIDLDLFSKETFDNESVINNLVSKYNENFILVSASKVGIFCFINDIKVDLIHYNFDIINQVENIESIRMLSTQDIAAMKIQAILGRGVKKDFFDLHQLLKVLSLKEVISFHKQKYPLQTLHITIPQAITYFEDAEESEDPVSLNNTSWKQVKQGLQKVVSDYLK